MPLQRPVSFTDAARGASLTLQPGASPRVDIVYQAPDKSILINAQIPVDPANQGAFDDLAAVMATPGAAEFAEQQHRFANLSRRAGLALPTAAKTLQAIAAWLLCSREDTNYTYDLVPQNRLYLAHLLTVVTGRAVAEITAFMDEIDNDPVLRAHIADNHAQQSPTARGVSDTKARYGRRVAWYALTRVLKPKLIVETGVDKGLGSVVLCAALLRNKAEGAPGRYLGTDIRPEAGALLTAPYSDVGAIAYGDSIATLQKINEPIDLFINDSDHSSDYEAREYQTIAPQLGDRAIILGDNAHVTDKLAAFAASTGRRFLFFQEKPADHFYPGGGIGIAFR